MSEFEQELVDYLRALRLPAASAQKAEALCSQHDFSSARVHLIISRPGYHSGAALGCSWIWGGAAGVRGVAAKSPRHPPGAQMGKEKSCLCLLTVSCRQCLLQERLAALSTAPFSTPSIAILHAV